MLLLIDNYDSFSYNLVQLAAAIQPDITVLRNDAVTIQKIKSLCPTHIILSPGPGYPKDAGICINAVKAFAQSTPILGVCLGHQAICEAFGSVITHAKTLMHGKKSEVTLDTGCKIFRGLPQKTDVARYHSLIVQKEKLSRQLTVTAFDKQGEIMAVQHKLFPVYGVQFHPESILTPLGKQMMENFLSISP